VNVRRLPGSGSGVPAAIVNSRSVPDCGVAVAGADAQDATASTSVSADATQLCTARRLATIASELRIICA
jgi:hypothetical protein